MPAASSFAPLASSPEATSGRVPGTISHRNELWDRCYLELMSNTQIRLAQEVARLGGHYAHVRDESIDIRHDHQAGEAWLHGRFSYMLYRRPSLSLATGTPLLLALTPARSALARVALDAVPASLRDIDVVSGCAADYDGWLVEVGA